MSKDRPIPITQTTNRCGEPTGVSSMKLLSVIGRESPVSVSAARASAPGEGVRGAIGLPRSSGLLFIALSPENIASFCSARFLGVRCLSASLSCLPIF